MSNWQIGLHASNDGPAQQECSDIRTLWLNVLIRGLDDASGRLDGGNMAWNGVNEKRAKEWIGSKDFHMVCDLAGMDADMIESGYRRGMFRGGITIDTAKRREAA